MTKRNRGWRKHKEKAKYIRRVKYWMLNDLYIFDNNGNKIEHPNITQCLESKWSKIYKNTGTPCSCDMCSYGKYNRLEAKKEFRFELRNAA